METRRMGFLCNLGRKLNTDLSNRGNVPSSLSCCPPFHGSPEALQHMSRHTFAALHPTAPRSTYPRAFFSYFSCLTSEPRSTGGGWARRV